MAKEKILVPGKRVGHGFVAGRQALVDALGLTSALAVRIGDLYVGRAGLVQYLKYVRGLGSTVRMVPSKRGLCLDSGSVGGLDLAPWQWIPTGKRREAEKSAVYLEVGTNGQYAPNVGAAELARAMNWAAPVAANASQELLKLIVVRAEPDRLVVLSTDSYRAIEATVPCMADPGATVAVTPDEARLMARALAKASRARVEFRPVEHRVWADSAEKTIELTQMVVFAGQVKVECEPTGTVFHPLSQGVQAAPYLAEVEYASFAYIGAHEIGELVKAAEVAAMDPDWRKGPRHMVLSLRDGRVEVAVYKGDDPILLTSMEAETTGEGKVVLDARLVLPALRSFSRGTVDLCIPASETASVLLQAEGLRYWVLPVWRHFVHKPVTHTEEPEEHLEAEEEAEAEVA